MRRMLLSCLMVVVVAWPTAAASAAEEIDWTVTVPSSGTVIGDEVRIAGPGAHRLLTIEDPGIEGDDYLIEGTVRYEGVEPAGYLEMWSFFADGGAYFSRTLAEDGPSAALVGASPGRPFEVPFYLNGSAGPERIEFGVVLPDAGTVWVGPLTLRQAATSTAWWSERRAAQIGATLGVLAGLSGAVIGMLGGRRRGRRLVEGLLVGGIATGVGALLAAGIALVSSQPRYVWYPLVLVGVILTVVDGALLPALRRNYAAAELQRIRALDA